MKYEIKFTAGYGYKSKGGFDIREYGKASALRRWLAIRGL